LVASNQKHAYIVCFKAYFNTLNHLGVSHKSESDGQTLAQHMPRFTMLRDQNYKI